MSPWPEGHVKKSKVISVRFTDEQFKKLEKKADIEEKGNVRALISRVISDYLETKSKTK